MLCHHQHNLTWQYHQIPNQEWQLIRIHRLIREICYVNTFLNDLEKSLHILQLSLDSEDARSGNNHKHRREDQNFIIILLASINLNI